MKRREKKGNLKATSPRRRQSAQDAGDRAISKRWTPALAKDGWTPISNFFLENYRKLSPPLTTPEAMLVVQLMVFKWDEKHPRPGFKTLATRMGISSTAARGHARKLEVGKHYLRRIKRISQTNQFDLTPLFDALEKLRATKKPAASGEGPDNETGAP